jgi:hypothetical protein
MYKIKKIKVITQLFIIGLVFFSINTKVQAYDYPIGIPDAWIDPDIPTPSRPADWSSEVAGYYYINNQTGSDSYTYGTPSAPRKTFPNPIPAGSYIELEGSYTDAPGDAVELTVNGSSGSPVWIKGVNPNHSKITHTLWPHGQYFIIEDIYFDWSTDAAGDKAILLGTYAGGVEVHHIMIRNCKMEGDGLNKSYGVSAGQNTSPDQHDIIVYNNEILHHGSMTNTADQDAHAVSLGANVYNFWLLDNNIHDCSGDGMQVNADQAGRTATHNIYAGNNIIYNTRQAGLWSKQATDVVYSSNIVHDIISITDNDSIGIGGQYDCHNYWIINNTIYNCTTGIGIQSPLGTEIFDVYVIGNLIYHITGASQITGGWQPAGIRIHGGDGNGYIVGNTVYDTDSGFVSPKTAGSLYIENNIFSKIQSPNGYNVFIENISSTTTIQNNVIFQESSTGGPANETINWAGTVYDLASFRATTSKGQNCTSVDPLFVNTSSYANLSLQAGSPAKNTALADTALTMDVYAKFQADFALDIRKDLNTTPRPQGSAWDIGAYEYVESSTIRADVDQNSSINSTDALLTLRNSLGLDMSGTNWQASSTTGDVNCDSNSNSADAMLILRHSLGLDMSGTGWGG